MLTALSYVLASYVDVSEIVNTNVDSKVDYTTLNIISYSLYLVGIVYQLVLIFNKNIDLSKHRKGILLWGIAFFISNIVSGVLNFIAYSNIKGNKKEKRELPIIEYKQFTNKYICLLGFILCMVMLFILPNYVSSFIGTILIYVGILSVMLFCFGKQLAHDFKYFKEYFKEYMSLTVKTWLKSLVVMMILGIILNIVTNTSGSNNQQVLQQAFNIYPIYIILLSVLYAPFAEELLFRGVIRKFIKSKYVFILVSGVLFGLLHVIDDSKTLAEFSYILVYSSLGIYLASLYYKTNNLWTNITFHFMQNTLGVLGMILLYFTK